MPDVPPAVVAIKNSFIAVVMGSSWESKDWSFESYCHLAEHIIKNQNRPVVLLGGRDQWDVAEKLVANTNSPNIINLTGNPLVDFFANVVVNFVCEINCGNYCEHFCKLYNLLRINLCKFSSELFCEFACILFCEIC